jgi:flagellar biosynthetic protein FliR
MEYLLDFEQLVVFLLVFTRILAFIASCPVFSIRGIPPIVKAGLAFVLSLALIPFAGPLERVPLDSFPGFMLALTREAAVGLGLGIFTSLVFAVVRTAGQYIGFQIGFALAEILNPGQEGEREIVSRFLWFFGLVLFFSIDGHHLLITGLAQSLELVPLGAATAQMKTTLFVAKAFGGMLTIALVIAAPVITVLLVVDVVLGLLERMVPQINVFMLGFPLKVLAGLFTLMVIVPVVGWVLTPVFGQMVQDLLVLMRLFGGA